MGSLEGEEEVRAQVSDKILCKFAALEEVGDLYCLVKNGSCLMAIVTGRLSCLFLKLMF